MNLRNCNFFEIPFPFKTLKENRKWKSNRIKRAINPLQQCFFCCAYAVLSIAHAHLYLQLPCPSWHQWRVHAWIFVPMNFSHMVILLTCYVRHLFARHLRLNGGSSKWKRRASCPTEWARESWRKQHIHSFSWDFIFFLILPNGRVAEWRRSFLSTYSLVQQTGHFDKCYI